MAKFQDDDWRCVCGNTPCDGLDCGMWLPGCKPRKTPTPKSAEAASKIRAQAWETRRQKYGERGHR